MKFTPSSTARRSTRIASSWSRGGPHTPGPGTETVDREVAAEVERACSLGGEDFRGHVFRPFGRRHRSAVTQWAALAGSLSEVFLAESAASQAMLEDELK